MPEPIIGNNGNTLTIELPKTFRRQGSVEVNEKQFNTLFHYFSKKENLNFEKIEKCKNGKKFEEFSTLIEVYLETNIITICLSQTYDIEKDIYRHRLKVSEDTNIYNIVTENVDLEQDCYRFVFNFDGNDYHLSVEHPIKNEDNKIYIVDECVEEGMYLLSTYEIFDKFNRLIIPPFQRKYSWSTEQVTDLLDDIERLKEAKKNHFLGNIVIIDNIIIDGQQRLTTLLLILLIMNEECIRDEQGNFKITLRVEDQNKIISILSNLNGKVDSADEDVIYGNYKTIQDWLKSQDLDLIRNILKNYIKIGINVLSSKNYDEIDLYESLNTKGLELDAYDIIKIILFSNKGTWTSTTCVNLFKKFEEDFGCNKKKTSIISLFRYYLVIKTGKLASINRELTNCYSEYLVNTYGTSRLSEHQFQEEIHELYKYFKHIRNLLSLTLKDYELSNRTQYYINWLVDIQSEIIPLLSLIVAIDDSKKCESIIARIMLYVVSYTLRNGNLRSYLFERMTHKLYIETKNNPERGNSDFIKELFESEEDKDHNKIFAMRDSVYSNFNGDKARPLLELYNNICCQQKLKKSKDIQVEHVFPQTPGERLLEKHPNYTDFIGKLGNLILLEKNINNDVNNKEIKYKFCSNKNELTYYDSHIRMVQEFAEEYGNYDWSKEEWDEEKIELRTQKIKKSILENLRIDL